MKFPVFAGVLTTVFLTSCVTSPPARRPPSPPPPVLVRSQVSMFDWRPQMVTEVTGRQVVHPSCVTIFYFSPKSDPRPKTQQLCIGQEFVGFRLEQIVPPKGTIPPWLVFRDLQTGGERLLEQMVTTRTNP